MKGHPVRGALSGFVFGFALALFLVTTGMLALDSVLILVLPVLFLIVGIGLAAAAPFKRDRLDTPAAPQ